MDQVEARALLTKEIEALRHLSYERLRARGVGPEAGDGDHKELTGPTGAWYQLETDVFWDDREGGNIRVAVFIDDGGESAYHPMSDDFIRAPNGSFVDEE